LRFVKRKTVKCSVIEKIYIFFKKLKKTVDIHENVWYIEDAERERPKNKIRKTD